MNRSLECFVTYCHDDDRELLDYLEYLLGEHSQNDFSLITDKMVPIGGNFRRFTDLLERVNAVIVLMTPSFNQRIRDRTGGVYEEYKKLMRRYRKVQTEMDAGREPSEIPGYFEIFPILISGDKTKSIPEELKDLRFLDLVGLRVERDKNDRFYTGTFNKTRYLDDILKLASSISALRSEKDPSFLPRRDEIYERWFMNTKADWEAAIDRDPTVIDRVFFRNFAYRAVEGRNAFLIIGRKGSGKSTITDIHWIQSKSRFEAHIAIVADEVDLEQAYSHLEASQVKSDTRYFFRRSEFLQHIWDAFLIICAMESLVIVGETDGYHQNQLSQIETLRDYLRQVRGSWADLSQSANKNIYFEHILSNAEEFINDIIESAESDRNFFRSQLQSRFSTRSILHYIFGDAVLEAFFSTLALSRKNLLITLDGFDELYGEFRQKSLANYPETLSQRAAFESEWLSSLLQVALRIKDLQTSYSPLKEFYKRADLCITVPKDRFIEIMRTGRDVFRYEGRYWSLDWSGIELCIMLRKRLEYYYDDRTNDSLIAEERLNEVWRKNMSFIPSSIDVDFNGKSYVMPLFMYVLRHTFWRPRDLLIIYARIISASNNMRKRGEKIDSAALVRLVKDSTRIVVNDQFFNEFQHVVTNIREIAAAFYKSKQVLSLPETTAKIEPINFNFASQGPKSLPVSEKIDLLYQIGFLGLVSNDDLNSDPNWGRSCSFIFNEGDRPLRDAELSSFEDYHMVVHPVFSELLKIDNRGTDLALQFDWKYLREGENLRFSQPPIL